MLASALAAPARAADVTLGILVPTTCQEADAGLDMDNAIKLAVSEANAKGGFLGGRITIVTADAACDPQQGATAGSKLVSSRIAAQAARPWSRSPPGLRLVEVVPETRTVS